MRFWFDCGVRSLPEEQNEPKPKQAAPDDEGDNQAEKKETILNRPAPDRRRVHFQSVQRPVNRGINMKRTQLKIGMLVAGLALGAAAVSTGFAGHAMKWSELP